MMRKISLVNEHYYHIFNRGVDKRKIFLNQNDQYRFIHDLFEFNDMDAVINVNRRVNITDGGETSISKTSISKKSRKLLVDIIVFCLMPNHFHLILKQKKDNGITKFMRKLGTGYTMYFNKVCQRSGSLFEGAFKSRYIDNDEYLIHLSRYVHLN
ncbi:MAG: transposase, partial [Candidatus Omnitrophica bacterium]|nr:transposase [Candidatus Omnitrophota bacterium]